MFGLVRKALFLDWDRRDLRIVVEQIAGKSLKLQDAHSVRLPASVDPADPQAMGAFIEQTLKARGLNQKRVVIDVPREDAVINRLVIPPTPFEELAAAVRFRAMQELPFSMESASVDFVIMKRSDKGLATEVLLAAVQLETLDRLKQTCIAAGLTPERIGLRPYANLTAVKELHGTGDKRVLFVDIGPFTTEINIVQGDELAFSRSANVAIPLRNVDPVGTQQDSQILTLVPPGDDDTDNADAELVGELLVEVTRTLQAFRAMEPDATIEEIVVAGRTGLEEQLRDGLDERFGLPCALFDPTEKLRTAPDHAENLRRFSAVLGLAWSAGHARHEGETLDFLNPKRPIAPRASLNRRIRMASIAAAVLCAGVGIVLGQQYYTLSTQLSKLKTANTEKAKKLKAELQILDKVEEVRDEWAVDAVWPDVLKELTEKAVEPGKKMVVEEITLDRRIGQAILRGVLASDWTVPQKYVEQLKLFTAGDKRLFDARQETWREMPPESQTDKFKGKVDVTVNLLKVQQHDRERDKREKARKERQKDL